MNEEYLLGAYNSFGGEAKLGVSFEVWISKIKDNEEYKKGMYNNFGGQATLKADYKEWNAKVFGDGTQKKNEVGNKASTSKGVPPILASDGKPSQPTTLSATRKYDKFDPEGSGYDYETADKYGLKPNEAGHYPSRVPETGQILKGRKHETYNKTVAGENAQGNVIFKGADGKYYSHYQDKSEYNVRNQQKIEKPYKADFAEPALNGLKDNTWATSNNNPYKTVNVENKNVPFVARELDKLDYRRMDNPDGTTSTVKMSAEIDKDGKAWAFPTIFPNEDGTWKKFDDNFKALEYAKKIGDAIQFSSIQEAVAYSKNGLILHNKNPKEVQAEYNKIHKEPANIVIPKKTKEQKAKEKIDWSKGNTASLLAHPNETIAEYNKRHLEIGSIQVGRWMLSTPEYVYDFFAKLQNKVADQYNIPELHVTWDENIEKPYGDKWIPLKVRNQLYDLYQKLEDERRAKEPVFEGDMLTLIDKGQYSNAFKMLTGMVSESLPLTTLIMLSGAGGLTFAETMAGTGVVTGAGYYDELQKQFPTVNGQSTKNSGLEDPYLNTQGLNELVNSKPNLSKDDLFWNATGYGLAEGVGETLGSHSIGKVAMKLFDKLGAVAGKEALATGLAKVYEQGFKKLGIWTGSLVEGIEELATQYMQNWIDVTSGVNINKNIHEGTFESFIVGLVSGHIVTSSIVQRGKLVEISTKEAIAKKEAVAKLAKNISELDKLDAELKNEDISDGTKEVINQRLAKLLKEGFDVVENEVIDSKDIPDKEKKDVFKIEDRLNELRVNRETVEKESSLGEDVKISILEDIDTEITTLNKQKNDLIDKLKTDEANPTDKTTTENKVDEVPAVTPEKEGETKVEPTTENESEAPKKEVAQPETVGDKYNSKLDVDKLEISDNFGDITIGIVDRENQSIKAYQDENGETIHFKTKEEAQAKLDEIKKANKEVAPVTKKSNKKLPENEQRRVDGEYTKDGVKYVRQPVKDGVKGSSGKVKFAENKVVDFEYQLVEVDELQSAHKDGVRNPNHFLPEVQPKDRTDQASLKQVGGIAQNLRAEELEESPNAYSGAPTANNRREIIQGANRTEGIRKHYEMKLTAYKKYLADNASKFGLTAEQVNAMKQPVLVRVLKATDAQAIELGNFDAKDIETGGKRSIDPIATSRRIPSKFKQKVVDILFKENDSQTLNEAIRTKFGAVVGVLKNYLNDAQLTSLQDKEGNPKPDGLKDIETLVQYFFFEGGTTELPAMFDSLPFNVREGLLKSLPKILSLQKTKSILTEIQKAVEAYYEYKKVETDHTFTEWKNQTEMFGDTEMPSDKYNELELKLAELLLNAKNQTEIKNIFAKYAEAVVGKQGDMFENPTKPKTKKQAVKDVFDVTVTKKSKITADENTQFSKKQPLPTEPVSEGKKTPPTVEERNRINSKNVQRRNEVKQQLIKLRDAGVLVNSDKTLLGKAKKLIGIKQQPKPMTDAEIEAQMSLLDAMSSVWYATTGVNNFYDTFIGDILKGDINALKAKGGVLFQDGELKLPNTRLTLKILDHPLFDKYRENGMISTTEIQNISKKGKPIEQDIINEVLTYDKYKDSKKISFGEFRRDVEIRIMKLERIFTDTNNDSGMSNLGEDEDYGTAQTVILNTPLTNGQIKHFSSDYVSDNLPEEAYEIKELGYKGLWAVLIKDRPANLTEQNIDLYYRTIGSEQSVRNWVKKRVNGKRVNINKGLYGHFRYFYNEDDKIMYVVEMQADTFQRALSKIKLEQIDPEEVDAFLNEKKRELDLPLIGKLQKLLDVTVVQDGDLIRMLSNKGIRLSSIPVEQAKNGYKEGEFEKGYILANYGKERVINRFNYRRDYSETEEGKGVWTVYKTEHTEGDYITNSFPFETREEADKYIENSIGEQQKLLEKFNELKDEYTTAWNKINNEDRQTYINERLKNRSDDEVLLEKQFWASHNVKVHQQRLIQEAIRLAREMGAEKVRFPSLHAVALIEMFLDFPNGETENDNPIPYEPDTNGDLSEGDTLEYEGDTYIVVEAFSSYFTCALQDRVSIYSIEDFIEEETRYHFDEEVQYEVENYFSDINAITKEEVEDWSPNEWRNEHTKDLFLELFENDEELETVAWSDISEEVEQSISDDLSGYSYDDLFGGAQYVYADGDTAYVMYDGHTIDFDQPDQYDEDKEELTVLEQEEQLFDLVTSQSQLGTINKYKIVHEILGKLRPDIEEVRDNNDIAWLETETTEEDDTNPIIAFQEEGGKVKGAIDFINETKANFHFFDGADISTLAHEFSGHTGRRMLEKLAETDSKFAKDYETVKEWAGVKDNQWSTRSEEMFARGFERYLKEGKAPTKALTNVFAKFAEWLTNIYKKIRGTSIDVELTNQVRKVFDNLLAVQGEKASTDGISTAKNKGDLYQINKNLFGLNRAQAMANAIVGDLLMGEIAEREGVDKVEIYSRFTWKKGDSETVKRLKDIALFQNEIDINEKTYSYIDLEEEQLFAIPIEIDNHGNFQEIGEDLLDAVIEYKKLLTGNKYSSGTKVNLKKRESAKAKFQAEKEKDKNLQNFSGGTLPRGRATGNIHSLPKKAKDRYIKFQDTEPSDIWKSTAQEGLDKIQQVKSTAEQWVTMIADKGGKGTSQELHAIGLLDFLRDYQESNNVTSIPKEVVQKYLDDNKIEVIEVTKKRMNPLTENQKLRFRMLGLFLREGNINEEELREYNLLLDLSNQISSTKGTKHDTYQLGGEKSNYREYLLILPLKLTAEEQELADLDKLYNNGEILTDKQRSRIDVLNPKVGGSLREKYATQFKTPEVHYNEQNVLAHIRVNDRVLPNGQKVLFIEELQSDWAQKGRKKGFYNPKDWRKVSKVREDENVWVVYFENGQFVDVPKSKASSEQQAREMVEGAENYYRYNLTEGKVPDMPYKKTDQWVGMAMRRILKMASDEGYDRVAWTTGKQQVDRWSLSNRVSEIHLVNLKAKHPNISEGKPYGLFAYGKDGYPVVDIRIDIDELENYVGVELAKKLTNKDSKVDEYKNMIEGIDIEIGGEGMLNFYDNIMAKNAEKEAQRFDKNSELETLDIRTTALQSWDLNNTPKMVRNEGVLISEAEAKGMYYFVNNLEFMVALDESHGITYELSSHYDIMQLIEKNKTRKNPHKIYRVPRLKSTTHQSIPITPTLRMNMKGAIPLFQDANGAIVSEKNKYIIYALSNPNASTPLHELAHAFEDYLTDKERRTVLNWTGQTNWNTNTSERFARGFEKYLADGEAPVPKLQRIFDKFKTWLTDIYDGITGSSIDFELNTPMKAIYSKMLGVNVDEFNKPISAEQGTQYAKKLTNERIQPAKREYSGMAKEFEDLIVELARKLKITLIHAKQGRKGMAGSYNPTNMLVSLGRTANVSDASHEIGHLLDDKFGIVNSTKGVENEIQLVRELQWFSDRGGSKPTAKRLTETKADYAKRKADYLEREGLAEFIRAYILNPELTKATAPNLYALFENSIDSGTLGLLKQFSNNVIDIANSPEGDLMLGHIDSDLRETDGGFRNWWESFTARYGNLHFTIKDLLLDLSSDNKHYAIKAYRLANKMHNDKKPLKREDFILLTRLYKGMTGVAGESFNTGLPNADKMEYTLDSNGEKQTIVSLLSDLDRSSDKALRSEMNDVMIYMIAQRTLEYAERLGRTEDLVGFGGGVFSDYQVAKGYLNKFEKLKETDPEKYRRVMESARRYREFADAFLRYAVDNGYLSEEAYAKMKNNNKFYISLARQIDDSPTDDPFGFMTDENTPSLKDVFKRIKGGTSKVRNPYVSLLRNGKMIMKATDKNTVMRMFIEPLTVNRVMGEGTPIDLSYIGRRLPDMDKRTIEIRVDGEKQYWQFPKPVYDVLNGFDSSPFHWLFRAFTALSSLIRFTITRHPVFGVRNIQKDTLQRLVVTRNNSTLADLIHTEEERRQYMMMGGSQGGYYLTSENDYKNLLNDAIDKLVSNGGTVMKLSSFANFKKMWREYEKLLQAGENINRIAEYKAGVRKALEEGLDPLDARLYGAGEARGLMDFAVIGSLMRYVNQVVPFSNPNVQAVKRLADALKGNPFGTFMGLFLYTILPTILNRYLIALGDDDNDYEQLEAWQRWLFWNFKTPFTGDRWISIPKPYEVGLLSSYLDVLYSKMQGNEYALEGGLGAVGKTLAPFDETIFVGEFKPIVENLWNHKVFYDQEIVPSWEENVKLEWRTGTKYASNIGQAIGKLTHTDPRYVDNLITGYGTYYAQWILALGDIGREDSRFKFDATKTGFVRNQGLRYSKGVNRVFELARELKLDQSKEMKDFTESIEAYYDIDPKNINALKTHREKAYDEAEELYSYMKKYETIRDVYEKQKKEFEKKNKK